MEPSRAITRKCSTCERKFRPSRRDAIYCSAACRQRAHRSRADIEDIDRRIAEARHEYWRLVKLKAEGLGISESHVVTDEAVTVTPDGRVYRRGEQVGTKAPWRSGWTTWGLEAGAPPFDPPLEVGADV